MNLDTIRRDIDGFAESEGRRPRILVVKLGQGGDAVDARKMATAFADIGFDVDVGPQSQTPEEAARQAIENDVHVVGVSTTDHKTLLPALLHALSGQGAGGILVIAGGVISPEDDTVLKKAGIVGIYGPDSDIPAAAAEIVGIIRERGSAN